MIFEGVFHVERPHCGRNPPAEAGRAIKDNHVCVISYQCDETVGLLSGTSDHQREFEQTLLPLSRLSTKTSPERLPICNALERAALSKTAVTFDATYHQGAGHPLVFYVMVSVRAS